MTNYVITGVLRNGKRFDPIHTDYPAMYNIWRGTVWLKLEDGKRKKLREIWN